MFFIRDNLFLKGMQKKGKRSIFLELGKKL